MSTDEAVPSLFYESTGLPLRVDVLDVPIDPWTMTQTVDATDWYIKTGHFAHLIGVNADKVLQMRDSLEMDSIVRHCEIVNADGASMVMASNKLGVHVPERVAGIDLMMALCALAEAKGYPIYLLGAKDSVVHEAAKALQKQFPALQLAGMRDGYFTDDEFDAVVAEVESVKPLIVFVGITSPKKELMIEEFRKAGAAGAFVGVGGSFDVISGNVSRAPKWMQDAGLEWLFRLIQEPGRLLKRYVVGNLRFYGILRKELKMKRNNG
ncbi:MAG: WecB/TagA/CpsF family glycosyltransferase [Atopobiaceae bacterium]|nr:WecB/TagA/CpsF family glycosyltransferase [Atopobiaceae bacterium]MCH4180960.1 WecB/TagA/CpsF family glycosyltransferase [Atopobiaceae bacterium]MCI1226373.1 WecB/TagA/CpsF family glycosyltransferase [Atopobiaceae bacterium]MCI1260366.1 WecB/TagA/CpsF family glycosyltransferase [Atopobiaceae bacterium]MDD2588054.1 WecB/TagA/CpsF family glycosyltransferase [Atopobiaceae bacterium]